MPQQPMSRALSQELALQCLDPQGRAVELTASFGYDPTDPYAVWITFPSRDGDVSWAMSRAVLLQSLTDPAGQGDLRLWPSIDELGRAVVVLEFQSPDGRLIAQANTQEVYRFLSRTLAAVPAGTESARLDVDAMIASILDRPGD
ncbi:SsgA family sporulation/cell division regulator [Nocardioides luti]